MRRPLVVGNWKMHGSQSGVDTFARQFLALLADQHMAAQVVVCPPSVYLAQFAQKILGSESGVDVGAQNLCLHHDSDGAFTGEISASMLSDLGCRYVIIGHSERRQYFAETDQQVVEKINHAVAQGLTPIVCVGEDLDSREAGDALVTIAAQIAIVIEGLNPRVLAQCVLAYEPIWAIGTGKTASPEQAQEVHQSIRAQISASDVELGSEVQILYGGSVKESNAAGLFAQKDIDGALVGGASLEAQQFYNICEAAG